MTKVTLLVVLHSSLTLSTSFLSDIRFHSSPGTILPQSLHCDLQCKRVCVPTVVLLATGALGSPSQDTASVVMSVPPQCATGNCPFCDSSVGGRPLRRPAYDYLPSQHMVNNYVWRDNATISQSRACVEQERHQRLGDCVSTKVPQPKQDLRGYDECTLASTLAGRS